MLRYQGVQLGGAVRAAGNKRERRRKVSFHNVLMPVLNCCIRNRDGSGNICLKSQIPQKFFDLI